MDKHSFTIYPKLCESITDTFQPDGDTDESWQAENIWMTNVQKKMQWDQSWKGKTLFHHTQNYTYKIQLHSDSVIQYRGMILTFQLQRDDIKTDSWTDTYRQYILCHGDFDGNIKATPCAAHISRPAVKVSGAIRQFTGRERKEEIYSERKRRQVLYGRMRPIISSACKWERQF